MLQLVRASRCSPSLTLWRVHLLERGFSLEKYYCANTRSCWEGFLQFFKSIRSERRI